MSAVSSVSFVIFLFFFFFFNDTATTEIYTLSLHDALPISIVAGHWADLEHTYTFTPNLINQFKYGFMNFGGPPVQNIGASQSQFGFARSGASGLPTGQASDDFPNLTFSGPNAPTSPNVSETFTALDNMQWLKGRHSITFGGQYPWLENNTSANGFDTASA